jgi:hypothetical protein
VRVEEQCTIEFDRRKNLRESVHSILPLDDLQTPEEAMQINLLVLDA